MSAEWGSAQSWEWVAKHQSRFSGRDVCEWCGNESFCVGLSSCQCAVHHGEKSGVWDGLIIASFCFHYHCVGMLPFVLRFIFFALAAVLLSFLELYAKC